MKQNCTIFRSLESVMDIIENCEEFQKTNEHECIKEQAELNAYREIAKILGYKEQINDRLQTMDEK